MLLLRPRDRNSKLPKKVHIHYPSGPQICHTCHTQICHTWIILSGPNFLGPFPLPRSPCIGFLIVSKVGPITFILGHSLTSKYFPFEVREYFVIAFMCCFKKYSDVKFHLDFLTICENSWRTKIILLIIWFLIWEACFETCDLSKSKIS